MIEHALIRDNERWLRFRDPVEVVEVRALSDVAPGLATLEEAVNARGLWAAGYLAYDAAPSFDPALCVCPPKGTLPLMLFGLFRQPERLDCLPLDGCGVYSLGEWQPSLGPEAHRRAVARIREHIARGDTYQVNHTFSYHASFDGDPLSLFYDVQRAQQADYAAYLSLDGHTICSASPELFLRLDKDRAICRPMKGTAARGHSLVADADQVEWLGSSEKNLAEHVMIVDMVRNERGELTESCLANLVVRRNGRLVTPPVTCGLLAGTFRAELLASGEIQEELVRVDELADAEKILLVNSVRRWMEIEWMARDA